MNTIVGIGIFHHQRIHVSAELTHPVEGAVSYTIKPVTDHPAFEAVIHSAEACVELWRLRFRDRGDLEAFIYTDDMPAMLRAYPDPGDGSAEGGLLDEQFATAIHRFPGPVHVVWVPANLLSPRVYDA